MGPYMQGDDARGASGWPQSVRGANQLARVVKVLRKRHGRG
jgi:hypothetical protein